MRRAPLANSFFRPEEKHVVSRENNVVPPPGCRNKAMEEPVAWRRRTVQANLQIEWFTRFLAAGMNLSRAMQRRRYPERIPGAVSEILRLIDDNDMLGWDAGKRRSHPDGDS